MPLILPSLQSELIDIFNKGKKGNPDPNLVGIDIGKAYFNYVSAGMNAAGFPFTGMTGASQLGTDLGDLLSKSPNTGPSHAATYSMRVNSCLSTFLSVSPISSSPSIKHFFLKGSMSKVIELPLCSMINCFSKLIVSFFLFSASFIK